MSEKDDMILAALARLEAGRQNDQTASAALREELTFLRVGLMERMDRIHNLLTSLRDDRTIAVGQEYQAESMILKHTRDELRSLSEVVSAMTKQITRLQTQVRELRGDP